MIEKNLIINNKDLFYNFFIKKILHSNYNQIFKSHLILYILNLKFNREFYNAHKGGVIKLSLPKNINDIINKFGIHTSILNSFFWKLSLLKKFLKENNLNLHEIKIIYRVIIPFFLITFMVCISSFFEP